MEFYSFQFPPGETKTPDLILGEAFVPGNDGSHFCKPTSVAVAEASGVIFVGDGYCNSRVLKFSREGKLLNVISEFAVVRICRLDRS